MSAWLSNCCFAALISLWVKLNKQAKVAVLWGILHYLNSFLVESPLLIFLISLAHSSFLSTIALSLVLACFFVVSSFFYLCCTESARDALCCGPSAPLSCFWLGWSGVFPFPAYFRNVIFLCLHQSSSQILQIYGCIDREQSRLWTHPLDLPNTLPCSITPPTFRVRSLIFMLLEKCSEVPP